MNYNTSTYQGKALADQRYKHLTSKGATIELNEVKETRTSAQNAARWLYLTMVSNELNEQGQTYQVTEKLEAKFTKDLLYNIYWKPLHEVMYPNAKRLNTKQFSEVAEMSIQLFAKVYGISIPFPSVEIIAK